MVARNLKVRTVKDVFKINVGSFSVVFKLIASRLAVARDTRFGSDAGAYSGCPPGHACPGFYPLVVGRGG
jgi:hypothetical protein